ncbi:uncharacterized protein MELLADRAFT_62874 [Melampsora larici-populina 98AG31]|uniref:Secreted protein n=1 Tax=Melampsora larici-populina (strain 98AG31 / pathotype 3-4-7) TaxID=747676 RepID=F4RKK4_MELLP|nr:uncharacterized protein MELLADRAFT_62874 [Melampsora larici-populina 98AG31]EGG07109.1 hypothetical protein MELLADRAFT_62874 [Melampsora larici-populina 98AG31]
MLIFAILFLAGFVTSYPLVPLSKGFIDGPESYNSLASQMIADEKLLKNSASISSSNAAAHLVKSRPKKQWQGCGILLTCLNPTRHVDDEIILRGSNIGSSRKRVLPGYVPPTPPRLSIVDDAWATWKKDKALVDTRERLDLAVFQLSHSLSASKPPTKSQRVLIQFMDDLYYAPKSSATERSIIELINRTTDLRNEGVSLDKIVAEYKLQAYTLIEKISLDQSDKQRKLTLRTIERLLEAGGLSTRPQEVKESLSASEKELLQDWDVMARSVINNMAALFEIMESSQGHLQESFKREYLQMQARVTKKKVFDFFYQLTLTLRSESTTLDVIYASERDKFLQRYLGQGAATERKRMIEYTNLLEGDLAHMLKGMVRRQNMFPVEIIQDSSHTQKGGEEVLEVHAGSLKHFQRIPIPISRDPGELDSASEASF